MMQLFEFESITENDCRHRDEFDRFFEECRQKVPKSQCEIKIDDAIRNMDKITQEVRNSVSKFADN